MSNYWQCWLQLPALRVANAWAPPGPCRPFWSGETDMRCMAHALRGALGTGYNHHIERLVLLCTFCTLAGVAPQAVSSWFPAAYLDAYEWLMLPNVIGMGLNADGGRIGAKPSSASANYINRMSDHCAGCRYNPRQRTGPAACPFNLLSWNFLIAHEPALRGNPRLGPAVLGLGRLALAERAIISRGATDLLERLCAA